MVYLEQVTRFLWGIAMSNSSNDENMFIKTDLIIVGLLLYR